MRHNFETLIKQAKEKEACISFELYRLLRNAISRGLVYEDSKCEFRDVIPEFSIGEKRADLIVFVTKYGRSIQPFLVVEVKARVYYRPGLSMAKAVKRALSYATELRATPMPFFAVYDGWELMIFRDVTPYLIGVYGSINDQDQAKNLLLGLEEFSYKTKKDLLNALPKHMDRDFLIKRVMPTVAKELAKDSQEMEAFLESWRQSLY